MAHDKSNLKILSVVLVKSATTSSQKCNSLMECDPDKELFEAIEKTCLSDIFKTYFRSETSRRNTGIEIDTTPLVEGEERVFSNFDEEQEYVRFFQDTNPKDIHMTDEDNEISSTSRNYPMTKDLEDAPPPNQFVQLQKLIKLGQENGIHIKEILGLFRNHMDNLQKLTNNYNVETLNMKSSAFHSPPSDRIRQNIRHEVNVDSPKPGPSQERASDKLQENVEPMENVKHTNNTEPMQSPKSSNNSIKKSTSITVQKKQTSIKASKETQPQENNASVKRSRESKMKKKSPRKLSIEPQQKNASENKSIKSSNSSSSRSKKPTSTTEKKILTSTKTSQKSQTKEINTSVNYNSETAEQMENIKHAKDITSSKSRKSSDNSLKKSKSGVVSKTANKTSVGMQAKENNTSVRRAYENKSRPKTSSRSCVIDNSRSNRISSELEPRLEPKNFKALARNWFKKTDFTKTPEDNAHKTIPRRSLYSPTSWIESKEFLNYTLEQQNDKPI